MRSRRFRHLAAPLIALLAVTAVAAALVAHGVGGHTSERRGSGSLTGDSGGGARNGVPRLALTDRLRQVPATPVGKLRFGLGPGLDSAQSSPLAPDLDFYSTWFNGPNDLGFLRLWKNDLIPEVYQSGHGIHLIVWLDGTGDVGTIQTSHGQACGRAYPLSSQFLDNARELASIFSGSAGGPPLYVTLFTEFQTYPCHPNSWGDSPDTTNYYLALQDQYLAAMRIFHDGAPNSRVSLGWGGWQDRWDDPLTGGGHSMIAHFADVMRASDFESFQAMGDDPNAADVIAMTRELGQYGPVMLAHFKSEHQSSWESDMRSLLTGDEPRQLSQAGLFAFSFMDANNINASPDALSLARGAIQSHGVHSTG
ncbi:conserved exported hypothetical protein [Frankia canadensis]|uniref:GH26 domain-containing protein n=1 Tax=Frankia canadensis TaxID=1836972 RepID=A0A2I2KMS0_9ACTN|nr:hypothetical protein [Frankia canadensis]SNQ46942.1 conserved exported hypothetical protein [Frankia canadensis]SOU54232.1 conserved exported hypothetical protein [Frankia canadensis]